MAIYVLKRIVAKPTFNDQLKYNKRFQSVADGRPHKHGI